MTQRSSTQQCSLLAIIAVTTFFIFNGVQYYNFKNNYINFSKHQFYKLFITNNNNNNDRLTAFDPGQPG